MKIWDVTLSLSLSFSLSLSKPLYRSFKNRTGQLNRSDREPGG